MVSYELRCGHLSVRVCRHTAKSFIHACYEELNAQPNADVLRAAHQAIGSAGCIQVHNTKRQLSGWVSLTS